MNRVVMDVELTMLEPLLGSCPGDKEVFEKFIASKAPTQERQDEEIDAMTVDEEVEKSSTIFPKDKDGLFLWDYTIRGFIKESMLVLIELDEIKEPKKWVVRKAVDSTVIVEPRRIRLLDASGNPIEKAEEALGRTLRAQTQQGERVALARSEVLPAGTRIRFLITSLVTENRQKKSWACIGKETLSQCLDYGVIKGLGQWRSGGYGRFSWEEIEPGAPARGE